MSCNDQKNPLQHNGTSQQQRQLPALQVSFVRVDERDFPDWIMFASQFAQYLNYYSEANVATNNWQPFFDNDIAAILGSIAIQNIDDYRRSVKERLDFLRDDKNEQSEGALEATLGSLFSAMLTLSLALDSYLFRLPKDHPLNAALRTIITQKLQPALKKLLAYYKGGISNKKSDGTIDSALIIIVNKDYPDWIILGRAVRNVKDTVNTRNLSPVWLEGKATLKDLFDGIHADTGIYGDEDAEPFRRIQHAANHNLFVSLFDQFLSSYARIIQSAETALLDALSTFNAHPPHYALFLTFLRIYRFAQDDLNTITQRHLDFYYQQVLRLSPKAALPNSAHLIAELAKGVSDTSLAEGTLFRAGKDSTGKEVFYALDKDTVFNQAKVTRLMSVYRGATTGINGKPPADNIGSVNNAGRLFASPAANSADGLGAALKTPNKEWHPFVNKTFEDGTLTAINMPKAAVGFAVASPYLSLAEGDREIQVKLSLAPFSDPLPATIHFDAYLTTAKEWLKVTATASVESISSSLKDAITVKIILAGDSPAITNYDAKVHGGTFKHTLPMLKIYLSNADTQQYEYDQLKNLKLTDVGISVFVGVDSNSNAATKTGAKQLQLANEFGPIDPSKPFQPFGLSPKIGSAFIAGSEEFFKKPGASFQLRLKWLDLPAASDVDYEADASKEGDKAPTVSVAALSKGAWVNIVSSVDLWQLKPKPKFSKKKTGTTTYYDLFMPEHTFPVDPLELSSKTGGGAYLKYTDDYGPYSVQRRSGYIRIGLLAGFGYDEYQKAYAKYLIDAAFGGGTDPGVPPYVPKLESISLHYSATTTENITSASETSFENKTIDFYHLYPFGEAEQHRYLMPASDLMMLPQFAHGAGDEDKRDSGEFYVGLTNLKGLQAVNLLFGVMEGTSDPLTVKPDPHVSWSYLSRNQWKTFNADAVSDGTAQLIQTGIISFAIPEDATTDNTMLPSGYLWLKASVNSATLAVCKLLGVDAQAAVVTFTDNGNASDFLNLPLAAGTIAKLKTPVSAVKKITQPYASFGGRPTEETTHYYMRVSERLRHKDRAITIWDYEHLILEAFPELHRVKCLSHTSYEQLSDGTKRYNEVAPGHVTIITIPSLEHINTVNPLRPYTSESTLAKIESFVRERISCHIQPHVVHPLFEEVALDFRLRLMPGYDDYTFYIETLKNEITAFLTPWAFGRSTDVQFGGKVVKSVLINFIEERPYVDYITNVKMYHRTEAAPNSITDTDEITASTGMAILVSVPAAKHTIVKIPDPAAANTTVICVDPANPKLQNSKP
jgi:hypothetical protein